MRDFTDMDTADMAAQCRMQATENLDPEYSRFMEATADRLGQSATIDAHRAQVLRWRLAWVKTDAECAIRGIGTMPTGYSDSEGLWTIEELVDELRTFLAPIAGEQK